MSFVTGLECHLCGKRYPAEASWVCSECLGPLKVTYDYAAMKGVVTRALIESRPHSLWRYQELLPVETPLTGFSSGFTPLVKADRLARDGERLRVIGARQRLAPQLIEGMREAK